MNKQFIYKTIVKWIEAKKGELSSSDKHSIEVATPPEFKGHKGIWTPEELFVASVNVCIMTTFLHYAEQSKLAFAGYESSAEGILEKTDADFMISVITIIPKIKLFSIEDVQKTKKIIELSEKNCFISNSMKSKIIVNPEIEITQVGVV